MKNLRNWHAVRATFRNSAGPMHDKREVRGGSSNLQQEYLEEYQDVLDDLHNQDNMALGLDHGG